MSAHKTTRKKSAKSTPGVFNKLHNDISILYCHKKLVFLRFPSSIPIRLQKNSNRNREKRKLGKSTLPHPIFEWNH